MPYFKPVNFIQESSSRPACKDKTRLPEPDTPTSTLRSACVRPTEPGDTTRFISIHSLTTCCSLQVNKQLINNIKTYCVRSCGEDGDGEAQKQQPAVHGNDSDDNVNHPEHRETSIVDRSYSYLRFVTPLSSCPCMAPLMRTANCSPTTQM